MKPQEKQSLIEYRMRRAEESIEAAELMLANDMLTSSMNRIYYAAFYSLLGLCALMDVSFSKHGQVKGYFSREFIKKRVFPIEAGRLYNKIFEYRQKFDYVDFAVPDKDMVEDYIRKTKEFIKQIEEYIQINSP